MSRTLTEIAEEALKLSQEERLQLARTLLERSETTGDVSAEAAWEAEIERRIQLIDNGLAAGRPFVDVDVPREVDRRLTR